MSASSVQIETEVGSAVERPILPNASYLSLSQIVRRSFRMVVLLWAARLLGVSSFGEYALLLTVVEMAAVVSGTGYITYLTREVAYDPGAAWPLSIKVAQVRLLLVAPVIAIAIVVLKVFHFSEALTANAALLLLSLVPRAAGECAQGAISGLSHFGWLPWVETIQGLIFLILTPALVLRGFGLRGLLIAEILAASAGAVCAIAALYKCARVREKKSYSLIGLLRSLYTFNIFPLITNVYDRADVVLLARLAGNFATGIYSLPYRILASLQVIPYGLMGALLPDLSASDSDRGQAKASFTRVLQFLYGIALLLILVAYGFARPLIERFLGPSYSGSVLAMKILIWGAVPIFLNHGLNTLLLAGHQEKKLMWTTSICTVFNIGANLFFIPRYSFIAAAVITVLTELLLLAQNVFLVARFLGGVELPRSTAMLTSVFLVFFLSLQTLAFKENALLSASLFCSVFLVVTLWTSRGLLHPLFKLVSKFQ